MLAPVHRFAVAGLAIGAVAGCTALASAAPSQTTVHQQDFGHTIAVHVGDTVKVDLLDTYPVPGSSIVWTADTSTSTVLQRVSSSREAVKSISNGQGHYTAVFEAIAKGSATIQATGAARCEAMNPAFCPQHSGTITVAVDQP